MTTASGHEHRGEGEDVWQSILEGRPSVWSVSCRWRMTLLLGPGHSSVLPLKMSSNSVQQGVPNGGLLEGAD